MIYPTSILSIEAWLILGTLILLLRYYIQRKWQFLANLNIPHDPPSILGFGNLKMFFDKDRVMNIDNEMKKKYGPIWGMYSGLSPSIVIHDPEILRNIMIKDFSSFPDRKKGPPSELHGKEFAMTLADVQGQTWKRQRVTLSPAFTSGKLKQMFGIIERCSDVTVDALKKKQEKENGKFCPHDLFSRYTLDTICSSAFSTNVHSQDPDAEEPKMTIMAKKMLDIKLNLLLLLLFFFPWLDKIFARFKFSSLGSDCFVYFGKLAREIIRRHKEGDIPPEKKRVDLMTLMLDAEIPEKEVTKETERGLTCGEIVGNATAFILGGYMNVTVSMEFLAYNMAQHPEIQRKLQDEIDGVVKERNFES